MKKKLAVAEGLEILARWLEDNINCETDLIFDNPEDRVKGMNASPEGC
ncbi:hypothetical protein M8R90_22985 [Enterobacter hormaechei]|nr:hypothetical protein [Enterobacter hormaechei]